MMFNQQRRMYGYGGGPGRPPDYGMPPYGYNPYAQRDYSTRPADMSDAYRGGEHLDASGTPGAMTTSMDSTTATSAGADRYKLPPVMKKSMLQKVTSNILSLIHI